MRTIARSLPLLHTFTRRVLLRGGAALRICAQRSRAFRRGWSQLRGVLDLRRVCGCTSGATAAHSVEGLGGLNAYPVLLAALALAGCGKGQSLFGSHPAGGPADGTFLLTAGAPVVRDRQFHTATVLNGGDVLLTGGTSATAGGPVAPAERYTPGPQSFAVTGSLGSPRDRHSATLLENGQVLIVGGEDASGVLSSAEIYDPSFGTFAPAAGSLARPRRSHSATRQLDGTVLIVGGDGGTAPVASIERYVPGVGFQPVGNLREARMNHSSIALSSGDTWIAGGFTAGNLPTATVEILDSSTGLARAAGAGLAIPRAHASAVTLADGRILMVGGFGIGGAALDSGEVYDPRAERSNGATRMSVARGNARAARMFDGRVLVTGDDSTADIFDPASATFVKATSSPEGPRVGHTATPLITAEVLIFGGTGGTLTSQIFDPR